MKPHEVANALVVEDDRGLARTLELILEDDGYQVTLAPDGQAALELLDAGFRPAVILSDIRMPRLDGLDLLRLVRKRPHLDDVPFIILSAKAAMAEIREGLSLGADDYIPKPFDAEDVLHSVQVRLQRAMKLREIRDQRVQSLIEYLPRALERPLRRLDVRVPPETGKTAGGLLLSAALQGVSAQLNALTGRLNLWQALTRKVAMLDATEAELTIQTGWREPVRRHLLAVASWHGREPDVTFDMAMGALHLPRDMAPVVLEQLVDNACRYTPPETTIQVEGRSRGRNYEFWVRDSGPGFSPEILAVAGQLDPFAIPGPAGRSCGFGLAICRLFARYVGAELVIRNRESSEGAEVGLILREGND